MESMQKKSSFQILTLITTPKLADKAADLFRQGQLPIQYRFHAEGTASSEIMDLLGLGSVDKCVLVTMLPKELSKIMLGKLKGELQMHAVNSGVAFTIPMNGMNNLILRMLTQSAEHQDASSLRKDDTEMTEMKHVMIAAIVNRGFSEDVMEAAKSVGAKGGTVIHSRQIGNEEAKSFWGISVQEEKEIVMILADAEQKVAMMKNIGERCGMHSEAKGIVLSMPVDDVVGI